QRGLAPGVHDARPRAKALAADPDAGGRIRDEILHPPGAPAMLGDHVVAFAEPREPDLDLAREPGAPAGRREVEVRRVLPACVCHCTGSARPACTVGGLSQVRVAHSREVARSAARPRCRTAAGWVSARSAPTRSAASAWWTGRTALRTWPPPRRRPSTALASPSVGFTPKVPNGSNPVTRMTGVTEVL